MEISKEDLEHAFWCANDPLYPDDLFNHAQEALKNDTLEIEGYVKAGWVKFDPDDETTYPPKGKFIAYGAFEGQPFGIFFGFNYDNESTKKAYGGILKHWMYAPKPPRD